MFIWSTQDEYQALSFLTNVAACEKLGLEITFTNQEIEIKSTSKQGFTAHFAWWKLDISQVIEPNKLATEDLAIQEKL